MTIETAKKLLNIFKNDMKRYQFKAACIEQNGKYWNNKDASLIRKHSRLVKLFTISKLLYADCKAQIISNQ